MSHKDAGQKVMKAKDMTIRVGYRCRNLKARGYRISAHSFRKFWLSDVTSHGMPESMAKWLCGKKIPASDGAYYDWEGRETQIYMDVYNKALALDKTSFQVEKLVVEQFRRDQTIHQMQEEITQLQRQLEETKEQYGDALVNQAVEKLKPRPVSPEMVDLITKAVMDQLEKEGRLRQ